MISIVKPFM